MAIELTLGMARTFATEALFTGEVRPEGVRLTCQSDFGGGLRNTGERHRRILAGELPGGECSCSSFLLARSRGVALTGLPFFPVRGFRHRTMFRHVAAPIRTPADLAGRRVTVHRYNSTTAVWAKGLLAEEYGVAPERVDWIVAEEDPPGEEPPAGLAIRLVPEPASRERAVELLQAGEIDAALEPYVRPGGSVRRIIEDYHAVEADWFRRSGVLPIVHTLALRSSFLAEHPRLAPALVEAFAASRRLGLARTPDGEARAEADWVCSVIGEDPASGRLGRCEALTLQALQRHLVDQRLLPRPFDDVTSLWAS